ncbi:hypothetical protein NB640_10965 [Oxalobacter vibrioformis]|uniref:Uncharacterized protein n=1 Tax=Oxalobacter vibrioformis TaxID=933080 RepID=A0A9E9P305_9BURK|nr:hypothetical protein [Oxalobacter vibrioformis]WAW09735.1 hypothetical protein NB640_10965 [Oxalobacter vibrioformis]
MAGIRLSNDEQKRLIMDCLHEAPMTVAAMAKRLLCSPDTIRKRLRELQEETRMVRVIGWDMKGTALVRIWGVGAKKRRMPMASLPSSAQRKAMQGKRAVAATEKPGRKTKREKAVPYRLEAMDKWLFAIRRAS